MTTRCFESGHAADVGARAELDKERSPEDRCPTAIVLGDRDEAIRCSHTKSLASAIPNAKLMVLTGVGHFAMRQDPGSYNQAIVSFIEGSPAPKLSDCR